MSRQKIIKTGNSLAVTVPDRFVKAVGVGAGQEVIVQIRPENGQVVLYFFGHQTTAAGTELCQKEKKENEAMKPRIVFWLIIILVILSVYIDIPTRVPIKLTIPLGKIIGKDWQIDREIFRPSLNLKAGPFGIARDLQIKQGIDLAGGAHLAFRADMDQITGEDRDSALESAAENIQQRVNLYGVSESVVQTSKVGEEYRLIVELPGVTDVDEAIGLIGQTAQLDFRELAPEATTASTLADYLPTGLTGAELSRSEVQFDQKYRPTGCWLALQQRGNQEVR